MDEIIGGSDEEIDELLTYYRTAALREGTAKNVAAEPRLTSPSEPTPSLWRRGLQRIKSAPE
jgi:hypothetical protein